MRSLQSDHSTNPFPLSVTNTIADQPAHGQPYIKSLRHAHVIGANKRANRRADAAANCGTYVAANKRADRRTDSTANPGTYAVADSVAVATAVQRPTS